MSGGWAGSDRSSRLPSDWGKRCGQVHHRSGRRCEFVVAERFGQPIKCGRPADGGVDHIIPGDDHSLENLRDTCAGHHRRKSSREGNEAKAKKKAGLKRAPEEHPGRRRYASA